jgi:hypothetical protein
MPKREPKFPPGLGLKPKLPTLAGLITGKELPPTPSQMKDIQIHVKKEIPYEKCPAIYMGHIKDFFEHGLLPKIHVINWALRNNLIFAISTCKMSDLPILVALCQFLFDHCPSDAWGSESNVLAWVQYHENLRKGNLEAYSIFKKASRDSEVIRSKAVHDCCSLLAQFTEFAMKDKDEKDLGVLPLVHRKAVLCLAGEYAHSLSIKIGK